MYLVSFRDLSFTYSSSSTLQQLIELRKYLAAIRYFYMLFRFCLDLAACLFFQATAAPACSSSRVCCDVHAAGSTREYLAVNLKLNKNLSYFQYMIFHFCLDLAACVFTQTVPVPVCLTFLRVL